MYENKRSSEHVASLVPAGKSPGTSTGEALVCAYPILPKSFDKPLKGVYIE